MAAGSVGCSFENMWSILYYFDNNSYNLFSRICWKGAAIFYVLRLPFHVLHEGSHWHIFLIKRVCDPFPSPSSLRKVCRTVQSVWFLCIQSAWVYTAASLNSCESVPDAKVYNWCVLMRREGLWQSINIQSIHLLDYLVWQTFPVLGVVRDHSPLQRQPLWGF